MQTIKLLKHFFSRVVKDCTVNIDIIFIDFNLLSKVRFKIKKLIDFE